MIRTGVSVTNMKSRTQFMLHSSTKVSVRIRCSPLKIYFWLSPDCLWVTPGHTAFTVTLLSWHSRGSTSCSENATTEIYMILI